MSLNRFQKTALCVAGVAASGIGAFILAAPHVFYAGYGIVLGSDANLLSELRAPAAGLLVLGVLMLGGMFRSSWTRPATIAAFIVFFAFPAGRLIGLIVDGMPSSGVLGALIVELAIAGLLLMAFGRRNNASAHATREPDLAR